MRLVFAGTPETALPSLVACLESRHEVVAVLTRPDARAGRGRSLRPSPVASYAGERGIEILRPQRPGDPQFLERLEAIAPDCCPVVAYGGLITQRGLDIPRHGWVNLHFSLLPAWRGAAPVQHALLAGDDITGATTFRLVKELDAGPTYGLLTETVRRDDTAGTLLERLAVNGAELLVRTLDGIETGTVEGRDQATEGISSAPRLTPEAGRVGWEHSALTIDRLVRAFSPDPGAWTSYDDQRLKLRPLTQRRDLEPLEPGKLVATRSEVLVGTGTHPVQLGEVQPPGKPWMAAAAWARGLRPLPGRLG